MSVIGDSALPRYRFEWAEQSADNAVRTTEQVAQQAANSDEVSDVYSVVEALADAGRRDDDCTVTMVGFESNL